MFLQQQTVPMPNQTFGGVGGALAAGRNHNKPGEEEVLGCRAQPPQAGRGGGGAPAPPRQRVRARPGQTTNPHSTSEGVNYLSSDTHIVLLSIWPAINLIEYKTKGSS